MLHRPMRTCTAAGRAWMSALNCLHLFKRAFTIACVSSVCRHAVRVFSVTHVKTSVVSNFDVYVHEQLHATACCVLLGLTGAQLGRSVCLVRLSICVRCDMLLGCTVVRLNVVRHRKVAVKYRPSAGNTWCTRCRKTNREI